MKRFALLTLTAVLALSLAGCDPTHDSIMKDNLDQMKKMVEILKTVKDESSAKAAAPKIKAINEEMKKLKEQADKLPKPTAEQQTELEKKYKADIEKLMPELLQEAMRIGMNPTLSKPLDDAMKDFKPGM